MTWPNAFAFAAVCASLSYCATNIEGGMSCGGDMTPQQCFELAQIALENR